MLLALIMLETSVDYYILDLFAYALFKSTVKRAEQEGAAGTCGAVLTIAFYWEFLEWVGVYIRATPCWCLPLHAGLGP